MAKDTAPPYSRGTPTERVRTAQLDVGAHVVTTPIPPNLRANEPPIVRPCGIALVGRVREVAEIRVRLVPTGDVGRSARLYTVLFTDGTAAFDVSPLVLWFTVSP